MSMLDKLKGLVGKSPDKANQSVDKAASAADEKTGGSYSGTIDEASEKAHGYVENQSEQDGQEQGGHGGEQRQ